MQKTLAAYSLDEQERFSSSSGGIFSLCARHILSEGGVVYGVTMSDDCKKAVVIRITDTALLPKLRGSKYLQAYTGTIFQDVKDDLVEGRRVLYSGTPCQVRALKKYLGKNWRNLVTVDIVCHGVPSPLLWEHYASFLEMKKKKSLKSVNFRYKTNGWNHFGISSDFASETVFSDKEKNMYMQFFLKNYCLRPSCYYCKVKDNYMSDITLGDFWGIDTVAPEMNDDKGISLVIVRSEAGKDLFEHLHEKIVYKDVPYENAVKDNPAVYGSVKKPAERESFFTDMQRMGMGKLSKKYLAQPLKVQIKDCIKKVVKHNTGGGYESYSLCLEFQK